MTDNLDNLIHGAFAEFEADERSSYLPVPGAASVRQKVAFQRRVRLTALSVAGALLIAVPIAAYAANPRGNNSPPSGVGSATPTTPASPTETASPTPSLAPPAPTVAPADVRNATLNLPAFPGAETSCKARGTKKFVNGTAIASNQVELIIGELVPIRADLDGIPGDEELTTIRCQGPQSVNVTQLLALKVASDGTLAPLGYVVNSADTTNMWATFSREDITVEHGIVRVTVDGPYQTNGYPPCDRQVRGYAFRNGAFRQVNGPTTFRVPSNDLHAIDFRNTGLLVGVDNPDGTGRVYCVPMVNGVGKATMYRNNDPNNGGIRYTFAIGPVSFVNAVDGEVTFAIFTLTSPSGEKSQTLQSFQLGNNGPVGGEVLRSGANGVTGIEKAEVSGDTVRVTVATAGGRQVWSYRPSATVEGWQRVS